LKFIALYLTGGVAASIVFVTMNPYALKRVLDFFAGKGGGKWHHEQFLYSLARGGWTGSSEGALWSNAYLPLPHTDSLYATIVESSGFIGGMIVLFLFLMIGFLFCRLAGRDGMSRCGKLYAGTVGLLCLVQALLHISVNLVILPTTGITLPFLSYGGSSLISTFAAFGIAFSAMRQGENRLDVESSTTAGPYGDAAPEQGSGSA
ncbi:MAG: FtsW/RodA/SpoVE family cell cycle protein, partial [Lentisphaeria bacterium]|nr:FtsW/RodA/SpoVE family cell cycle protein [Lentisphaeria bacterium]